MHQISYPRQFPFFVDIPGKARSLFGIRSMGENIPDKERRSNVFL